MTALSAGAQSAVLFEDIYQVTRVNPEGKKFDRVDRLMCKGETFETDLFVDVACEVYPLRVADKFTLTLTSTLNLDGRPDADEYTPDGRPTLLDEYDYGMCGKVFKYDYLQDKRVAVVASFGGLLMLLQGDQRHLVRIQLDQKVYALMRKTGGSAK